MLRRGEAFSRLACSQGGSIGDTAARLNLSCSERVRQSRRRRNPASL
jgi:hypothetical protein